MSSESIPNSTVISQQPTSSMPTISNGPQRKKELKLLRKGSLNHAKVLLPAEIDALISKGEVPNPTFLLRATKNQRRIESVSVDDIQHVILALLGLLPVPEWMTVTNRAGISGVVILLLRGMNHPPVAEDAALAPFLHSLPSIKTRMPRRRTVPSSQHDSLFLDVENALLYPSSDTVKLIQHSSRSTASNDKINEPATASSDTIEEGGVSTSELELSYEDVVATTCCTWEELATANYPLPEFSVETSGYIGKSTDTVKTEASLVDESSNHSKLSTTSNESTGLAALTTSLLAGWQSNAIPISSTAAAVASAAAATTVPSVKTRSGGETASSSTKRDSCATFSVKEGFVMTRTACHDFHIAAHTLAPSHSRCGNGCVRDVETVHSMHSFPSPRSIALNTATTPRLLALDCEMCGDVFGADIIARVTVVDEHGATLLDEYVKPNVPIKDYRTPFSGVTPRHLQNAKYTFDDIRMRLVNIIDGVVDGGNVASTHTAVSSLAIHKTCTCCKNNIMNTTSRNTIISPAVLVGHSLESDLHCLRLLHSRIADTSMLFPHRKGLPYRRSLRHLVQSHLSRDIQAGHGTTGHDSVEDTIATMELYRLLVPPTQHNNTSTPSRNLTDNEERNDSTETPCRSTAAAGLPATQRNSVWASFAQRHLAAKGRSSMLPNTTEQRFTLSNIAEQLIGQKRPRAENDTGVFDTAKTSWSPMEFSTALPPPVPPTAQSNQRSISILSVGGPRSTALIGSPSFVREHVCGRTAGIPILVSPTPADGKHALEKITSEVTRAHANRLKGDISAPSLVVGEMHIPWRQSQQQQQHDTMKNVDADMDFELLDSLLQSWVRSKLPLGTAVVMITQQHVSVSEAEGTNGAAKRAEALWGITRFVCSARENGSHLNSSATVVVAVNDTNEATT